MVLVGTGIYIKKINYFKVKHVFVNNNLVTERQRIRILAEDMDKDLYFIDLHHIKERVQSIYTSQNLKIIKKYPDTIDIHVYHFNLLAYMEISGKHGTAYRYGLDSEGRVKYRFSSVDLRNQNSYPVIKSYLPDIAELDLLNPVKTSVQIENVTLKSVMKALAQIKSIDPVFFTHIVKIHLYQEYKKNYLKVKGLRTRFYFGKRLSIIHLIKILSLRKDLSTRVAFKTIDLRFYDIIGRN
ncbi:MAG: hypothetical protein IEMM0008_0986 [bacterium]|nr:MAG: hypothetical protein IEMM0008_0986 [bacterium]